MFAVDDCDAALTAIRDAGGSVMAGPFDMDIGRSAMCGDPQGAAFQIIELAEPVV